MAGTLVEALPVYVSFAPACFRTSLLLWLRLVGRQGYHRSSNETTSGNQRIEEVLIQHCWVSQ